MNSYGWMTTLTRDALEGERLRRILRQCPRLALDAACNAMGRRAIYVGGMECTGSTMVYQLVKGLGRTPVKAHEYIYGPGLKLVTFRDPRDVVCSHARRQFRQLSEEQGVTRAILASHRRLFHELQRHNDLRRYRDDGRSVLLRYEDYFGGNESWLLEMLLTHLHIALDPNVKNALLADCSLVKNLERSRRYERFSDYDAETQIHGHHISSGGRSGVWKELFDDEVRDVVKRDLGDFLIEFAYERDLRW